MEDVRELIRKHHKTGLLIDANLLLLYLVGQTNPNRILSFKRTSQYVPEDFDLLTQFVAQFQTLVTTPHILTEVSNLGDLRDRELLVFRSLFTHMIEKAEEHRDESRRVVKDAAFLRLGLTDAAILALGGHAPLFLTDDLDLYVALTSRSLDAINFNHIRPLNWTS